ncbi:hypothetical protein [Streptomyces cavernae]|uniref:hypothetical protein n=1 Tax=Streptomyces cavernae TaxID=2259034 RepID=UPI000FEBA7CB|nr:hypothetical protein [Streptomyces cavernae]
MTDTTASAAAQLIREAAKTRRGMHGKHAAELLDQHGHSEEAEVIRRAVVERSGHLSAKQAADLLDGDNTPKPAKVRHTFRATARHADGTDCTHKISPRGKAVEPGCTGRHDYRASCTCGTWQDTGPTRAALEFSHTSHRSTREA